jgi:hypothetical protein
VGGEIHRIGSENEHQWATQHVTIIHQNPAEPSVVLQSLPEKSSSYLSWDVPNNDPVASVPLILSSENNVAQEVIVISKFNNNFKKHNWPCNITCFYLL